MFHFDMTFKDTCQKVVMWNVLMPDYAVLRIYKPSKLRKTLHRNLHIRVSTIASRASTVASREFLTPTSLPAANRGRSFQTK
ncbi:hypothetical protein QR680_005108 [Steinernema hermaphroditum]|uniref:Uncharacterized protein n=1 Tax=Steinernema hermaphroditum TaxID=289476 RepID=A0AA39HQV7_9BILA|nr:hypothetical protein QR680_005108 [Steinernema hermaphroditum]